MNVYELTIGHMKHFIAAESEEDAQKKGADPAQYPDIYYLPFTITQVVVPGHTLTATPEGVMSREAMKQWLKDKGIEFTPQWGDDKLRELIAQHTEGAE